MLICSNCFFITRPNKICYQFIDVSKLIDKTEGEYLKNLFTFAFHTGMRLAEITNMKWDWIDMKNKSIKIKNDNLFTTKSKGDRIIPMNNKVLGVISIQNKHIDHLHNVYIFYRIIGIKLT